MSIRMAQYGVKHGHAAGKARAMLTNPEVTLVGVYEPDGTAQLAAEASQAYADCRWLPDVDAILSDPTIIAVAIEGGNSESLTMAAQAVAAGKHVWCDKPAGDDWPGFQRLMADGTAAGLLVQLGYMFRYHAGFRQIADWVKSGRLGDVFSVHAHMSTWLPFTATGVTTTAREHIAAHRGGIFYDLGGHMLDQVVWLLGRPERVSAFLRNDASPALPSFRDNTLGVFEFGQAMAMVDIAAMEARPSARRFEVYGAAGSAIMEPFEPAPRLYLHMEAADGAFPSGRSEVTLPEQQRQSLYDRELAAFVATICGRQPPDRSPEHELLVQETLLRASRGIGG